MTTASWTKWLLLSPFVMLSILAAWAIWWAHPIDECGSALMKWDWRTLTPMPPICNYTLRTFPWEGSRWPQSK
jgi:hypothetical protein